MLGKLMRAISLLLFAWFVFMIGSVIYAATWQAPIHHH